MVRQWLLGIAAIVVAAGPVLADETFESLVEEFNAARHDWYQKVQAIAEQRQKEGLAIDMSSLPTPPEETFAPKIRAFAEKHAGTPRAVPALGWLVDNPVQPEATDMSWALSVIRERHAADGQVAAMMKTLPFASFTVGREPVIGLCEKVLEVNEHADARAGATYALAVTLFDTMLGPGDDPKRAAGLFRGLVTTWPDSEFAKEAGSYLFEIDHLQVGMKAPEVVGTSLPGNEVKLSQFEGQVVVLDFWGFW